MASRKNQHFVPQFYFRYFSKNGKSISVLNRKTGCIIKAAPIKGQASKSYFYGNAEVESSLSQIEGLFGNALREIKASNSISECSGENVALFIQNILLQKARTLTQRNSFQGSYDRLLQLFFESQITSDASLSVEDKRDYIEHLPFLTADPTHFQAIAMKTYVEGYKDVCHLEPVLLENRTNRPFIFGDAPVVFTNPFLRQITLRGVLGLKCRGLIIFYPLSPDVCAMLIDPSVYKWRCTKNMTIAVRALKDIAFLNKLQIHNASSAIYFSDYKFGAYVHALFEDEKEALRQHHGSINEAPGIDANGDSMGEVFHSFEKQLPLIPRLGFLKYEELEEENYNPRDIDWP